MRPAVVSGVCTRDVPVTSCLIFSLSLVVVLGTLTQHRILLVSKVVITVNDVINAHFQIIASYLINALSTLLKLYSTPLFNKRPLSDGRPL